MWKRDSSKNRFTDEHEKKIGNKNKDSTNKSSIAVRSKIHPVILPPPLPIFTSRHLFAIGVLSYSLPQNCFPQSASRVPLNVMLVRLIDYCDRYMTG